MEIERKMSSKTPRPSLAGPAAACFFGTSEATTKGPVKTTPESMAYAQ
jgi:hypothetical protein